MGSPELLIDGAVARITLRRPAQANRLEPDVLKAGAHAVGNVQAEAVHKDADDPSRRRCRGAAG